MNRNISKKQIVVLKQVVSVLEENGIKYQVHGGLAAIIYGAKRKLYDIDIDIFKKDIKQVRVLFKDFIKVDLHREMDEEFDLYLMSLEINGVLVDIDQVEETYYLDRLGCRIRFDPDLSKSCRMMYEGVEMFVENKDELISYKKILSRKEDLEDLQYL